MDENHECVLRSYGTPVEMCVHWRVKRGVV